MLLAGPSGAGKSTLLRALAGVLLTADAGDLSGAVLLDGEPVGHTPGAAGLLLQDPADAVVAARIGRDAAFGPENLALTRAEIWVRVADSLAAVRFPYGVEHRTEALSGGERQRLALAGAVSLQPRVLLLDEPTSMLDPATADAVRSAVLEVACATGATLVVAEHHLEAWIDEVDRLVVLDRDGRVVADGSPRVTLADQAGVLARQGVWLPDRGAPDVPAWPVARRSTATARVASVAVTTDQVTVAGRLPETSVELRFGELTALSGPSGAGKSTLLATLAGLQRPSSGQVLADPSLAGGLAADPSRWASPALARRIGWVPQHAEEAFVARTVREEVLAGLPAGERAAAGRRVDDVLDALDLAHLAAADPYRLSGGEQRRLAVAAALVQAPAVLLLDEPTVGQDRGTWSAVVAAIDSAVRSGAAVAVATHDPMLIDRADRRFQLTLRDPSEHEGRPGEQRSPWGPLAVLIVALLAVAGSAFVRQWRVGVVLLGVQILLSPFAIRSIRQAATRLIPGLLAAASIGWSSWLLGGHHPLTGLTAALRILTLVVPGALLTAQLDLSRLGDDLAQRLRLPARPVVAIVAALQRLAELRTVWSSAAWARKVRGLGAGRNPFARVRESAALSFVLLVQSVRRAGRMSIAMDARGFAGAHRRTWAEPSRWAAADTVLALAGLALAMLPVALDVALR